MAAEIRWRAGALLCYSDRFRSGLAEMIEGIEALEAMPSAAARMPAAIQGLVRRCAPGRDQRRRRDGRGADAAPMRRR